MSHRELTVSVVSGGPFPSVLFRCREVLFLIFKLLPRVWENNFIFSLMSFLKEKVIISVIPARSASLPLKGKVFVGQEGRTCGQQAGPGHLAGHPGLASCRLFVFCCSPILHLAHDLQVPPAKGIGGWHFTRLGPWPWPWPLRFLCDIQAHDVCITWLGGSPPPTGCSRQLWLSFSQLLVSTGWLEKFTVGGFLGNRQVRNWLLSLPSGWATAES